MGEIISWLMEGYGNYRGQPIPNWFVIIFIIFTTINIVIFFSKRK
jgi:hypothetical protein